jgi:hypothetical protein
METIAIEFLTQDQVTLTEGLLQMLDTQVSSNTFIFVVEFEELEMLLDELDTEMNLDFVVTKLD